LLTALKGRNDRGAEVRICHDHRDAGLTLACDNQRGAGQMIWCSVNEAVCMAISSQGYSQYVRRSPKVNRPFQRDTYTASNAC
jgi:hypothetical protein